MIILNNDDFAMNVVLNVFSHDNGTDSIPPTGYGSDPGEGFPNPTTLTFTSSFDNGTQPQIVTVTGRDDYYDEDNVTYIVSLSVEAASTQDEYDSIVPDNVTLVNIDNDTSGFVYGNISDNISENGSI